MSDNVVGKLHGLAYHFKVISRLTLLSAFAHVGLKEICHIPLTFKEFPTNFTRDGIIARKS